MNFLKDKAFIRFIVKFLLAFAICYYGTYLFIGITVPGGYYSPFAAKYLNYVSWVRQSLLYGTEMTMAAFHIQTYRADEYIIRITNGTGIRMVYQCLGFGVMSFWVAFVFASATTAMRKIYWILAGLLFIWIINVIRLSFVLVATNKGWPMPLGLDHHTWFNILSYGFIFMLIYFFTRKNKNEVVTDATEK